MSGAAKAVGAISVEARAVVSRVSAKRFVVFAPASSYRINHLIPSSVLRLTTVNFMSLTEVQLSSGFLG